MEGKYRISVFGLKVDLPKVVGVLEKALESESSLNERVQLNTQETPYIDHGQNPAGDSDCRSYIQVRDPNGKMIFPKSRKIRRFCQMDVQTYVKGVKSILQESMKHEA